MENLQNINEKLESRIRVFNNQGRWVGKRYKDR
jgi:hypothetical protein